MEELFWLLGTALTIAKRGQTGYSVKLNSHFLKSLEQKKKKEAPRRISSPSPRLYRRRASHACRASLLSKPRRAAWFRQRMARVKATPSYHCPASRPQISSKVTLALSLLPCALSDLSLKARSTRQSGGVRRRSIKHIRVCAWTVEFCLILHGIITWKQQEKQPNATRRILMHSSYCNVLQCFGTFKQSVSADKTRLCVCVFTSLPHTHTQLLNHITEAWAQTAVITRTSKIWRGAPLKPQSNLWSMLSLSKGLFLNNAT